MVGVTFLPMSADPRRALATHGVVNAVCAGPVRALRSPRAPGDASTAWRSAILKELLEAPVHVGTLGLRGDAQKETKHHGGPVKAVLIYGAVHYARWLPLLEAHAAAHRDALQGMSPAFDASRVGFGAFGENLTVDGLDEHRVCIGDVWSVGGCVLRITEPRAPCSTLTRRWMRPALLDEVKTTAAAGWYNAVVEEGAVTVGDRVSLVERLPDAWTIARVFHVEQARVASRAEVQALHDAEFTPPNLRAAMARRLETPARLRE